MNQIIEMRDPQTEFVIMKTYDNHVGYDVSVADCIKFLSHNSDKVGSYFVKDIISVGYFPRNKPNMTYITLT